MGRGEGVSLPYMMCFTSFCLTIAALDKTLTANTSPVGMCFPSSTRPKLPLPITLIISKSVTLVFLLSPVPRSNGMMSFPPSSPPSEVSASTESFGSYLYFGPRPCRGVLKKKSITCDELASRGSPSNF